jgi:hypothetical protein
VSVTATCQALAGQDAAGTPITYDPVFTLDGVGETAWRCPGSAVGQQLVFDFGTAVTVASVGLVPGYDKTDPVDGSRRRHGALRVALPTPERTGRVVLQIAGTGNDTAIRDFTAISDVAFAGY